MLQIRKRNLAPHQLVAGFGVFTIGMVSSISILHALNAPEPTPQKPASSKVRSTKSAPVKQTEEATDDAASVVTGNTGVETAPAFETPQPVAPQRNAPAPGSSQLPKEEKKQPTAPELATDASQPPVAPEVVIPPVVVPDPTPEIDITPVDGVDSVPIINSGN